LTGTFDVCSGEDTTILEQYKAVSAAIPLEMNIDHLDPRTIGGPVLVPAQDDDVQPDVRPDRGVPGWAPTVQLAEGVVEAVHWYQTHGLEQTYTHLAVKA
jgi:nucleoside-diphosphate-sugar epimerase